MPCVYVVFLKTWQPTASDVFSNVPSLYNLCVSNVPSLYISDIPVVSVLAGLSTNLAHYLWVCAPLELTIAQRVVFLDSMPSHSTGVYHCVAKRSQRVRYLSAAAQAWCPRSSAFCETKGSGFQVQGIPQEEHREFLIIVVNILH